MPSEDPSQPASGRAPHTDAGVAIVPFWWIFGASSVLVAVGMLLNTTSPYSPGGWSRGNVGVLLMMLGMFVLIALPGVLLVLRHPWGVAARQMAAQRFHHPRLAGLVQMWMGVVVPGGFSAMLLLHAPDLSLLPLLFAVFLVGTAPFFAVVLFDRRR